MSAVPYSDRYRILAVDPSSSHNGYAVLDYDLISKKVYVVNTYTVARNELLKLTPWLRETYGDRQAAVECYRQSFNDALFHYDPTAIVVESPYKRFLTAFRALTELQAVYRTCVIQFDHTAPFYTVEPSVVKKNIGVKGGSKEKSDIPKALALRKDLVYNNNRTLLDMDEHQHDAIAVGLFHIDTYASKII